MRVVRVDHDRWAGWLTRFGERHGELTATVSSTADLVTITAADGAVAEVGVPWPPLVVAEHADPADQAGHDQLLLAALAAQTQRPRTVGALLVRKGGHAVGIFDGRRLVSSKVGSNYVQGRTKAGGWSQQRFARRRDNQSRQAYAEAADVAARILFPAKDTLDAIVLGGDRTACLAVLDDPRLAALADLVLPKVHPTADPRLRVLEVFPESFLSLDIGLNDLA